MTGFFFFLVLVNCGDPGSPFNGQKLGTRYWTGESVSFICHPGYHLIGPATRMCLTSGNWSGVQPSCKRNYPILCQTMQFHFIVNHKIGFICDIEMVRTLSFKDYACLSEKKRAIETNRHATDL